jgi:nucleoside phosphorylase
MTPVAVVITALPVEFAAVAGKLTATRWDRHPQGTRYQIGTYHDWTVAVAQIGRGNEEAGYSTERALEYFNPAIALFVGVAGGIKDVAVGDVVFATEVHGYEYGKETDQAFMPRGQVAASSYALVQAAVQLSQELAVDFAVVVEPIAAGGKIVADATAPSAQVIKRHYSQVVATEQEGLGFLKAASTRPEVAVGVVRGISDLLSGKSDSDAAGWQDRAARNAARFALDLLDLESPEVTIETVGAWLMTAWLRLRGWAMTSPDLKACVSGIPSRIARGRAQRLLADLQDILTDRLDRIKTPDLRPAVAGLQDLVRDPPAVIDIGTVQQRLHGTTFLSDLSAYLVESYLAVPELNPDSLVNLVDRELRSRLEHALDSLPNRVTHSVAGVGDPAYRTDYLRAVGHRLDFVQILGIDLARTVERYSLTTAYVSLSASASNPGRQNDVENVLSGVSAMVLVGEAGSGKTTLLQWIAVSTARDQLPPQLDHWRKRVPFLIRLRKYVSGPLPNVEDFTTEVAATLEGRKPQRWCSDVLKEGEGIVLIDGLDELPAERRPDVQNWIDDLLASYPDNIYIISTRPAALRDNAFKLTAFETAELLPMGPSQITALVQQWHKSTGRDLPDRADHQAKGDLVAQHILQTPALLDLARTPLLCAVLCALAYNHKGVGSLPQRRIELYNAALSMLTGRRDSERKLAAGQLGSEERLVLLEDLAQWLVRNGYSEIPRERALTHIGRTLLSFQHISITPEEALTDLIERSVLREPATDVLDFAHRTFEEYLAARWMHNQGDLGALLVRAEDPAYSGVIALVAGLSRPKESGELISKLIDRELYTLAVSCIDACLRVEPEVIGRLRNYFAALVPPTTVDEQMLLVAGGNTVVALLEQFVQQLDIRKSTRSLESCVDTLARIGTPDALRVLAEIPAGLRGRLAQSLIDAWSHFPPADYAARVLTALGTPVTVTLKDSSRIPFTGSLPHDYVIRASAYIPGHSVAGSRLHHLTVVCAESPDLSELSQVDGLQSLQIHNLRANQAPLTFPAISGLRSLSLFLQQLGFTHAAFDCAAFHAFPNLTELQLDLDQMRLVNINALNNLPHLHLLELHSASIMDTSGVSLNLLSLQTLQIPNWPADDFTAIAGCTALEFLDAKDSDVVNLDGLEGMNNLRSIDLRGCSSLTDITGINELQFLEDLDLIGCASLDENTADIIESLPAGIDLEMPGAPVVPTESSEVWADSLHIRKGKDFELDFEASLILSVVGDTFDDEDDEFAYGWLVGPIADIEHPSSEQALTRDQVRFEGLG